MLDLGPRARLAFAATYVVAQLAIIGYGLRAPDHAFGFQMFNESSRLQFRLLRRVHGKRRPVPVVDGAWQARGPDGQLHTLRWSDRVRDRVLGRIGIAMHASRGLEGQLFRLQHALDDVMAHAAKSDVETRALIAVVRASHNGRPERELRLVGRRR